MKRRTWLGAALTALSTVGVVGALDLACSSTNEDPTPCNAPLHQCGSQCSDPQSDPNNCGACGVKCDVAKAEVCSQGTCALACGGGTTKCGSACVDLQNDARNCGGCGTACAQGESCSAGKCGVGCGAGLSLCGGTSDAGPRCVDLANDVANCGACGTACGLNATCQAGACKPTLATTTHVEVTGGLPNCTLGSPAGGKSVITSNNELFVEIVCDGAAYVVSSTTGGLTYGEPMSTGLKGVGETSITVQAGPKPVLYLAASIGSAVVLVSSTDRGKTWTAPLILDAVAGSAFGLAMATWKDTLYVLSNPSGGGQLLRLRRNGPGAGDAGIDGGSTGFALTTVDMGVGVFPSDVMIDPKNGDVWVGADQPNLYAAKSTNGGASFAPAVPVPGSTSYSDWALAKDTIFVAGLADPVYALPTSSPTTPVIYTGFGATTARGIAVDEAGTAYIATPVGNAVNLHRLNTSQSGTLAQPPRVLPALGAPGQVSIASGPVGIAFVSYTVGGKIWATVQKL